MTTSLVSTLFSFLPLFPQIIHNLTRPNYKLAAKIKAPPNNAPIPAAPVCKARAAPPVDIAGVAPGAPDPLGAFVTVVGAAATSDVNGTLPPDAVVAPEKAGAVVVGFGVADALAGFRTL